MYQKVGVPKEKRESRHRALKKKKAINVPNLRKELEIINTKGSKNK